MASVFGFYKVKSVEENENKEFPYSLVCVDSGTKEEHRINSKRVCPIGTTLYWEYNYKIKKYHIEVIPGCE